MDRPLKDMVILVTGGAKRVGAAVCRRLHAAGASVMVHYRASEADARALVAELGGARPHSAALTQADLLKEGAAAFHRQLVKGDLSVEYGNEIRLWLEELKELEESERKEGDDSTDPFGVA